MVQSSGRPAAIPPIGARLSNRLVREDGSNRSRSATAR